MNRQRSLYEILNISADAEPVVIEAAYKALIKRYHPDQNSAAATAKAAEINNAFSILKDPVKRAAYDKNEAERYAPIQMVRAAPVRSVRATVSLWSGWFVAILFGGVSMFLMNQPANLAPARVAAPKQVASEEVKDNEAKPLVEEKRAAFVDALALEDLKATQAVLAEAPPPPTPAPPDPVPAEPTILAAVTAPAPHIARKVERTAPPPAKRSAARPAPPPGQKDADFLESRGYVY